jgi:hypothetical protein
MRATSASRRQTAQSAQLVGARPQLDLILGEDANHAWTAFGPTNFAIHRVSASAELCDRERLGDAQTAIAQAKLDDTTSMPLGTALAQVAPLV